MHNNASINLLAVVGCAALLLLVLTGTDAMPTPIGWPNCRGWRCWSRRETAALDSGSHHSHSSFHSSRHDSVDPALDNFAPKYVITDGPPNTIVALGPQEEQAAVDEAVAALSRSSSSSSGGRKSSRSSSSSPHSSSYHSSRHSSPPGTPVPSDTRAQADEEPEGASRGLAEDNTETMIAAMNANTANINALLNHRDGESDGTSVIRAANVGDAYDEAAQNLATDRRRSPSLSRGRNSRPSSRSPSRHSSSSSSSHDSHAASSVHTHHGSTRTSPRGERHVPLDGTDPVALAAADVLGTPWYLESTDPQDVAADIQEGNEAINDAVQEAAAELAF